MGFCINSDAKDVVPHKKYERRITFNKAQVAKSMQPVGLFSTRWTIVPKLHGLILFNLVTYSSMAHWLPSNLSWER